MNFDREISVHVKLSGPVDGKTPNVFDISGKQIAVDIPNTISVGEVIRLKSLGQTAPDGTRGDLYLRVQSIDDSQLYAGNRSCKTCGQPLKEGTNFCPLCGTPVGTSANDSQRETTWSGHIVKCPSCGAEVNSFTAFCPSCGHELRGSRSSRSLQEFYSLINCAQTISEKASIIRNFPVPNTREDVLEYSILASSNLIQQDQDSLFDAWVTKFEQCIQKSRLLCHSPEDLAEFEKIHSQTQKIIRKRKLSRLLKSAKRFGEQLFSNLPRLSIVLVIFIIVVFELFRIVRGKYFLGDFILDFFVVRYILRMNRSEQETSREDYLREQRANITIRILDTIKIIFSNPASILIIGLLILYFFDHLYLF